jgi:hypothetical protein
LEGATEFGVMPPREGATGKFEEVEDTIPLCPPLASAAAVAMSSSKCIDDSVKIKYVTN